MDCSGIAFREQAMLRPKWIRICLLKSRWIKDGELQRVGISPSIESHVAMGIELAMLATISTSRSLGTPKNVRFECNVFIIQLISRAL